MFSTFKLEYWYSLILLKSFLVYTKKARKVLHLLCHRYSVIFCVTHLCCLLESEHRTLWYAWNTGERAVFIWLSQKKFPSDATQRIYVRRLRASSLLLGRKFKKCVYSTGTVYTVHTYCMYILNPRWVWTCLQAL